MSVIAGRWECEWVDGQARCRLEKGHPARHQTDGGRLLMDPVLPPSDNPGRCRSLMPERGLQCQMNRDHTAEHHMNGNHRWKTCTDGSPCGRRCLGLDRHPGMHHCEDSSTGQASSWTNNDPAAYCQSKFRGTKCLHEAGHEGLHANSPSFWSSEHQDFADGSHRCAVLSCNLSDGHSGEHSVELCGEEFFSGNTAICKLQKGHEDRHRRVLVTPENRCPATDGDNQCDLDVTHADAQICTTDSLGLLPMHQCGNYGSKVSWPTKRCGSELRAAAVKCVKLENHPGPHHAIGGQEWAPISMPETWKLIKDESIYATMTPRDTNIYSFPAKAAETAGAAPCEHEFVFQKKCRTCDAGVEVNPVGTYQTLQACTDAFSVGKPLYAGQHDEARQVRTKLFETLKQTGWINPSLLGEVLSLKSDAEVSPQAVELRKRIAIAVAKVFRFGFGST